MPFNLTKEQLQALHRHVSLKSKAVQQHEQLLADELSKGTKQKAFHTISRHGPQTGWESQLVRLFTGQTPDQRFAPSGVRSTISSWKREGQPDGSYIEDDRNLRYAAADTTGAFISPEVEVAAINLAQRHITQLKQARFAEMMTSTAGRQTLAYMPFKYIEIIVHPPFPVVGLSFMRTPGKTQPGAEDAMQAIDDYTRGGLYPRGKGASLWDEMMFKEHRKLGDKAPPLPQSTANKLEQRFKTLDELLKYLCVDAIQMPNVRLVFKRVPDNSLTWKLHTAYPVSQAPMIRPDAPGKWTGNAKALATAPPMKLRTRVD